ncbi:MAG TPA: iron-sulfur cluster assembly scaffold protein [Candidatus Hydrogenedentes bacterium]|nr:iron-sulfur cluster assembly scaffold protein [Candidatus Hydrogenedentota bacterium]HPX86107.1 iron-sulfur cluster assembly scaffold protein [Candidatus Hydrogenedentota bacterium]
MSAHQSWAYTEQVKDHFVNPRNVLREENYEEDGKGLVGNIQCGDEMLVLIKVDRNTDTITDCKWRTYGCASAIASTSAMSEIVIGMPLDEAFKVGPKQITAALGQLPNNKIHCSVLGDKALRAAINDYYERNGRHDKVVREQARVVCTCMNVTDLEIEEAVLEGARTFLELQEQTKMSTVCGKCRDEAETLLKVYMQKHFG